MRAGKATGALPHGASASRAADLWTQSKQEVYLWAQAQEEKECKDESKVLTPPASQAPFPRPLPESAFSLLRTQGWRHVGADYQNGTDAVTSSSQAQTPGQGAGRARS